MLRAIVIGLLLTLCAVAKAEPSAVERFWQGCVKTLKKPPDDGFYRVRYFGRTEAVVNVILPLIRGGEKTVTFTSPWIYVGDSNATPVVGGFTVVTDFSGHPELVIRTTSLETKPFDAVSEADSQYEGPAVRPLEAWRNVHWRFFSGVLEPLGRAPSQDMPVTVERFEVVCTKPVA
jgi:uncharacterized protein YhfF